jgi:hypothetical protein
MRVHPSFFCFVQSDGALTREKKIYFKSQLKILLILCLTLQWHRYQAECKLVSLWEDIASLEQNTFVRDHAADDIPLGFSSISKICHEPNIVSRNGISERSGSEMIDLQLSHDSSHRSSCVIELASSIAMEAKECLMLCIDLNGAVSKADWCRGQNGFCASFHSYSSGSQANCIPHPRLDIEQGRADRNHHCSTVVLTSEVSSSQEVAISALRMQLEKKVHELEAAKEEFSLRESQFHQEILRYVEDEQKLSLQAVEREEELEAVVSERSLLKESQKNLSFRLSEAQEKIQNLQSANQLLLQELSGKG